MLHFISAVAESCFKSFVFTRGREPHIFGTPSAFFGRKKKPAKINFDRKTDLLKFFLDEPRKIEPNPGNETKLSRTLKSSELSVGPGENN